jgi:hypothetical protein
VAQFAYGLFGFGRQLYLLGLSDSPQIDSGGWVGPACSNLSPNIATLGLTYCTVAHRRLQHCLPADEPGAYEAAARSGSQVERFCEQKAMSMRTAPSLTSITML